jgi:hypothetical protein
MLNLRVLAWLCTFVTLAACSGPAPAPAPTVVADVIYFGGDIVTVNDKQPTAEALAVKDGRILAVGNRADLTRSFQGAQTRSMDLKGHALLPGFLDPHSHYIAALPLATQANVFAPPAGPGADPASIVAALVKFRDDHKVPRGEVIQAYGYDDSAMPKGAVLTRYDLDKAFPDNPVVVGHVSMHGAVLNSAAMKKYGVSAATRTPRAGSSCASRAPRNRWACSWRPPTCRCTSSCRARTPGPSTMTASQPRPCMPPTASPPRRKAPRTRRTWR